MRSARVRLVIAATAFAAGSVIGSAQVETVPQAPVFRAATDAVRVDVLATDERGVPLPGLTAADLRVEDNGVPQRVALITVEKLPLHVVLTLDASGNMEGERRDRLLGAAAELVHQLGPEDRVTLVSFTHRVAARTFDAAANADVITAIRRLQPAGWTSVFDAVWVALMKAEIPGTRPLVVLLTDGFDNKSWLTGAKVLQAMRRLDAVVYPIAIAPPPESGLGETLLVRPNPLVPAELIQRDGTLAGSDDFLRKLADTSGGRLLSVARPDELQTAFLSILEEFRERYVLTYEPQGVSETGWHALNVRLVRRSGKITARQGYER